MVGVCRAAATNAFDAIALRNGKFMRTPVLASLAKQYAQHDPDAASLKTQSEFFISADNFVAKYLLFGRVADGSQFGGE